MIARRLFLVCGLVVGMVACGLGLAWAASQTTGTNVSCATATASLPGHTVGVDGAAVDTIAGATTTASQCNTVTYTVPTVTQTVAAAGSGSSTTTAGTTTAATTTTATTATSSGALAFDGTFSTTDPAPSSNSGGNNVLPGPHWRNAWGNCYSYISSQKEQIGPVTGCNPSGTGGRTDLCTSSGCSATSVGQAGLIYHKGTEYCTTIPFYLPAQLPSSSGSGQHVGMAEMKDNSSTGGDWTMSLVHGGASGFGVGFTGGAYGGGGGSPAYTASTPVTAGVWHTGAICQNAAGTTAQAWFDGQQLTFNQGSCKGLTTCTGLNLYYDGKPTSTSPQQPLDISLYTGGSPDPWTSYDVIHGDPLVASGATSPPVPACGSFTGCP